MLRSARIAWLLLPGSLVPFSAARAEDGPAVQTVFLTVREPEALPYFVGVFLKNRGDLETAKTYLIRCAQSKDWQKVNDVLACQTLRVMKVQVPPAP
jgi:hypothetical protein